MSENHPGPLHSHPTPGPASVPDLDGEAQTRVADAPFQLSQEPVTAETATDALAAVGVISAPAYEHLGELPASYGTQSVYLVAYDPRQLFAYWDLSPADTAEKKYSLHVCAPTGEVESREDIMPSEAGRYLAAGRPRGTYYVELGTYSRNGAWQAVATSGRVTLPPEGLAGETEPKFATLPFHLSFQRLMELIEGAMGSQEDLTAALARLQRGERPAVSSLLGALSHLSKEQLHTLEMILGEKFAMDSQAGIVIAGQRHILRDRHEVLTSPGQSSDTFLPTAGGGSENLSSGALLAGGSEALSSAGLTSAGLSSERIIQPLGSESVSSFSDRMGSEAASSFALPLGGESSAALTGGMGSETISSFAGGLGSESLSSFGGMGSETLSSGGLSSGTMLSFLMGMSSETLSSLFAALGGSETLGSGMFGPGPSSEAWRLAGASAGPGSSSDTLSSEQAAIFLRAVETNLDVLSSLFSHGFSSSDSFASPGSGGNGGNHSSEGLARKKSLW